jgi:hypothetical protein
MNEPGIHHVSYYHVSRIAFTRPMPWQVLMDVWHGPTLLNSITFNARGVVEVCPLEKGEHHISAPGSDDFVAVYFEGEPEITGTGFEIVEREDDAYVLDMDHEIPHPATI